MYPTWLGVILLVISALSIIFAVDEYVNYGRAAKWWLWITIPLFIWIAVSTFYSYRHNQIAQAKLDAQEYKDKLQEQNKQADIDRRNRKRLAEINQDYRKYSRFFWNDQLGSLNDAYMFQDIKALGILRSQPVRINHLAPMESYHDFRSHEKIHGASFLGFGSIDGSFDSHGQGESRQLHYVSFFWAPDGKEYLLTQISASKLRLAIGDHCVMTPKFHMNHPEYGPLLSTNELANSSGDNPYIAQIRLTLTKAEYQKFIREWY